MSVIVNNTQEVGDTSEWDFETDADGDLNVTTAAALAGSYGIAVTVDDANVATVGMTGLDLSSAAALRFRFYIDPNNLTMGTNERFTVLTVADSSEADRVCQVLLGYDGADYYLWLDCFEDLDSFKNRLTPTITDASHYVEIKITKASSDVAGDGNFETWVDGVSAGTVGSVDIFDTFALINAITVGMVTGRDAGTSGTFYLDDVVVRDDGTEIGPASTVVGPRTMMGIGT